MASVMSWTTSKKATTCKHCKRIIPAGEIYLNIPKNYRSMAGNICPECEKERLYWGGHIVSLEDKGKKRKPKKFTTEKQRDIARQRISAFYGGRN